MVLLLAPVAHAQAPIVYRPILTDGAQNIEPFIEEVAKEQKVSPRIPENVVKLESNYEIDAVGDKGLAYSVAQFHEETFNWMKQKALDQGQPFFYLEYKNPADQITLLVWAIKNGYGNSWSTYKQAIRKF